MPEVVGRFVDSEAGRAPAINSWALLYTATNPTSYGVDVCNGGAADAHINIAIIPTGTGWTAGNPPPAYAYVARNIRVEADGVDGNTWVMPVKNLNAGDMVAVWTDVTLVTFYGHGFKSV